MEWPGILPVSKRSISSRVQKEYVQWCLNSWPGYSRHQVTATSFLYLQFQSVSRWNEFRISMQSSHVPCVAIFFPAGNDSGTFTTFVPMTFPQYAHITSAMHSLPISAPYAPAGVCKSEWICQFYNSGIYWPIQNVHSIRIIHPNNYRTRLIKVYL